LVLEKIPNVASKKLALPSTAPKLKNFPISTPPKILFPTGYNKIFGCVLIGKFLSLGARGKSKFFGCYTGNFLLVLHIETFCSITPTGFHGALSSAILHYP